MKPPRFDYVRPAELDEALVILEESRGGAKILAGGQSLVPLLNMRLAFPETLVDVNRIGGLDEIVDEGDRVRVGAMVRQTTFGTSPVVRDKVPLAARCVPYIGHFVTRNRGTVGGSLAHADSQAELPVVLVALGGSLKLASRSGSRQVQADDFFVGDYTTSMEEAEMLVESTWPAHRTGWGFGFAEFAMRHGDYALGMVACGMRVEEGIVAEVRLVAGSVAPRPLILRGAAEAVAGRGLSESTVAEARDAAMQEVEPSGDIHASGEYRRALTGTLAARALESAWRDANEGGR